MICCTGAHLLPATGKLKKLPTMARAVNTPARASRLVREESDDKVVCVINKHSLRKKYPSFIKRMEGTKSKKEEMRGHLCQINTWYESLRWHYPNQVKGRNGITLPLSRFSPTPLLNMNFVHGLL